MSAEAQAPRLPVLDGGGVRPDAPAGRLITRAAELVVLAEELYLRLFVLALVFVLVSALVSIWFAAGSSAPLAVTLPFSVAAAAFAVTGLRFPRRLYGWLRYSELAPAGPGAPRVRRRWCRPAPTARCGGRRWRSSSSSRAVSSLRLSLAAAVAQRRRVRGRHRDRQAGRSSAAVQAGILAGAVGFVAYTLVGSFVCEAFARFVLGFERLERLEEQAPAGGPGDGEPRRVTSVVLEDEAPGRHPAPASARTARPRDRLVARPRQPRR